MAKCKACPHLTSGNFCGTPVVGDVLDDGSKLCGCAVNVKARLRFASCPQKKWAKVLSSKEIDSIRVAIKGRKTSDVWELYAKYIGQSPHAGSNCPPCVREALTELQSLL